MTDKTTDSTQPESSAQTEGLTRVEPGHTRNIRSEPVDRTDPPVADLARELSPEIKDAVRREGDWADDGDRNNADDAQDVTDKFVEKT